MTEVERFIFEYRLDKYSSPNPELVVNAIKVNVRPKTYRRIGSCTWHSSTRVWFKEDIGKLVGARVILAERDDAKALDVFIAQEAENVKQHREWLQNAINRCNNVKAITHAIEDTRC